MMIDIFKPPTDNLYKFMGVSGIVLIVAGFILPPVLFRETGMEYLAQLRSREELKVHEEFTKQRLQTLDLRQQRAIDEKNKLQKRLNGLDSASNSGEVDKLEGRIKEANREIESIADASHELSLNLALKQAQTKNEETVSINRRRDSRLVVGLGWVVALIGVGFSVFGFWWWYKRLQKLQDGLVAKEAEEKLAAPTETNNRIEQKAPPQPGEVTVSKPAQPTKIDLSQPTK